MIEEIEDFVEIEKSVYKQLTEKYPITQISFIDNQATLYISDIPEEDFEDFGNEISAYHDNPNEYFELLKHNWHTAKKITIGIFETEFSSKMTF